MVHHIARVNNVNDATPELGNRLRVVRAEKDLSQAAVAAMAGVTRQTIIAIESGGYCPSVRLALVLARALGRPVDEIFFLKEEES
ncbi:MAG: helix-turn-helix transcriptional regulator [Bacillota bacterium]|nr:helix-turn-helix transcriptional regulator [Bacillota bacterium]